MKPKSPIYDSLLKEYQSQWYLKSLHHELMPVTNHTFDICEDDYDQVPAVLNSAADAIMRNFANEKSLARMRKNFEDDQSFDYYVVGFQNAIEALRRLPLPKRHD